MPHINPTGTLTPFTGPTNIQKQPYRLQEVVALPLQLSSPATAGSDRGKAPAVAAADAADGLGFSGSLSLGVFQLNVDVYSYKHLKTNKQAYTYVYIYICHNVQLWNPHEVGSRNRPYLGRNSP